MQYDIFLSYFNLSCLLSSIIFLSMIIWSLQFSFKWTFLGQFYTRTIGQVNIFLWNLYLTSSPTHTYYYHMISFSPLKFSRIKKLLPSKNNISFFPNYCLLALCFVVLFYRSLFILCKNLFIINNDIFAIKKNQMLHK
jgi:hypothetical protein